MRRLRRNLYWIVPVLNLAAALALGAIIPRIDRTEDLLPPISAASAIAMLSTIATGMIAFTGFVASQVLVAVQISGASYSPRLVGRLRSDPGFSWALGFFAGTALYSLSALSQVAPPGLTAAPVPSLTVTFAVALLVASFLVYFALLQRVRRLQVASVLRGVGDAGRAVIARLYPDREPDGDPVETPTLPHETLVRAWVHAGPPMVLARIDGTGLARAAAAADAIVEIRYAVGDTVPNGAALVHVHRADDHVDPGSAIPDRILARYIHLADERSIDQDPKYAIRLIVDVAIRALSPAVNDPTTAVQALDQLDDLLRRLGTRRLDVGRVSDATGALRVVYPTPDWPDLLELAVDEIRLSGTRSLQVVRRLRALLEDLREAIPEHRRPAVDLELRRLDAAIPRSFDDVVDRRQAVASDRQGLGVGDASRDSAADDERPRGDQAGA